MSQFEMDSEGNLITRPVVGWKVASIASSAILVQIRYVDNPEELEKDKSKAFQFVLTPPVALELAGLLTTQAQRILNRNLPPGKRPH